MNLTFSKLSSAKVKLNGSFIILSSLRSMCLSKKISDFENIPVAFPFPTIS